MTYDMLWQGLRGLGSILHAACEAVHGPLYGQPVHGQRGVPPVECDNLPHQLCDGSQGEGFRHEKVSATVGKSPGLILLTRVG